MTKTRVNCIYADKKEKEKLSHRRACFPRDSRHTPLAQLATVDSKHYEDRVTAVHSEGRDFRQPPAAESGLGVHPQLISDPPQLERRRTPRCLPMRHDSGARLLHEYKASTHTIGSATPADPRRLSSHSSVSVSFHVRLSCGCS